jgi:hypothetical protein
MDTRITDLRDGFLLGGANAFGGTALMLAALYSLGCLAAQLNSLFALRHARRT